MRDAERARGGLDARRFERFHELLEALALFAAEEVRGRHVEIVEADLELLHAAIAQNLDFAAGHAFRREGVFVRAARLLGDEHGETLVTLLIRDWCG